MKCKGADIGDFNEVAVIELMVKAGDRVLPEQSLITVESDKASMEIPAPVGGVVRDIKVKVGDKVSEGQHCPADRFRISGNVSGRTGSLPKSQRRHRPGCGRGAASNIALGGQTRRQ